MLMNDNFCTEQDRRIAKLREDLQDFYSTASEYTPFHKANYMPDYWLPIANRIKTIIDTKNECRVFEFGAGRTGFAEYLRDVRDRVHFCVQDVTTQNQDYLAEHADCVHIKNILDIDDMFDVIFSTFVWEHLTNPQAVLNHLLSKLTPGGSLFIASPRYDMPFYSCPSLRHYPRWEQIKIGLWLVQKRLRVLAGGSPDFLININPSVLHRPWYRDADAVHMVSRFDLSRSLHKNYLIRDIRFKTQGLRHWILCTFLQIFVEITKPPSAIPTSFSSGEG